MKKSILNFGNFFNWPTTISIATTVAFAILTSEPLNAAEQGEVCMRNSAIRDVLVKKVSLRCERILPEDLLLLKKMIVHKTFNFESKDLAELSSLDYLELNQVDRPLVRGLFSSVSNLNDLALYNSRVRSIESGAFENLSRLKTLTVTANYPFLVYDENGSPHRSQQLPPDEPFPPLHIESIEPNAFAGLENLRELTLGPARLENLKTKTFAGLPNLMELGIGVDTANLWGDVETNIPAGEIKAIESGAFAGLEKLKTLRLEYLKIGSIQAGALDGLNALEKFYNFDPFHLNRSACFPAVPSHLFDSMKNLKSAALCIDMAKMSSVPEDLIAPLGANLPGKALVNLFVTQPEKLPPGLMDGFSGFIVKGLGNVSPEGVKALGDIVKRYSSTHTCRLDKFFQVICYQD